MYHRTRSRFIYDAHGSSKKTMGNHDRNHGGYRRCTRVSDSENRKKYGSSAAYLSSQAFAPVPTFTSTCTLSGPIDSGSARIRRAFVACARIPPCSLTRPGSVADDVVLDAEEIFRRSWGGSAEEFGRSTCSGSPSGRDAARELKSRGFAFSVMRKGQRKYFRIGLAGWPSEAGVMPSLHH